MKKITSFSLACIFLFSSFAFGANAPRYSLVEAGGIDFAAPMVAQKENLHDIPVGTIVYDVGTKSFQGLDYLGNWIPMGLSESAARSEVILYSTSSVSPKTGFGTTATAIRRFEVTQKNEGTGISVSNTDTLGTVLTINEPGVYAITYSDIGPGPGAGIFGISLNASGTDLTTALGSLAPEKRVAYIEGPAGGYNTVTAILALKSGDVIRPHTNSSSIYGTTDSRSKLAIVKVTD